jgi:hypothetical protein
MKNLNLNSKMNIYKNLIVNLKYEVVLVLNVSSSMGFALVGDWDTRRGPVSISCRVC